MNAIAHSSHPYQNIIIHFLQSHHLASAIAFLKLGHVTSCHGTHRSEIQEILLVLLLHTHSRHYFFILPVVAVGRLPSLSLSLLFEYFAFPNIDYLAKDLTLFGKLEFGGAMKPTDDGIPVLTDRVGALEIHNKILY